MQRVKIFKTMIISLVNSTSNVFKYFGTLL